LNRIIPLIASILILGSLGLIQVADATSVTIDFTTLGTFTTPSLVQPGVTVTGSNTVNVRPGNGLGIVGGIANFNVDGSESITFTFDNPSSGVSYLVQTAGDVNGDGKFGAATIEAFDSNGISLGTVPVDGLALFEVSMIFGNDVISKFTVTADVDSHSISSVTFNLLDHITILDAIADAKSMILDSIADAKAMILGSLGLLQEDVDDISETLGDLQGVLEEISFIDTETIDLDATLSAGDFKLLMDITPFESVTGHVAMKVPCDKQGDTDLAILTGVAPDVAPITMDFVAPLSDPGKSCVYHGDIEAGITDIVLANTGKNSAKFGPNEEGFSVTITIQGTE